MRWCGGGAAAVAAVAAVMMAAVMKKVAVVPFTPVAIELWEPYRKDLGFWGE